MERLASSPKLMEITTTAGGQAGQAGWGVCLHGGHDRTGPVGQIDGDLCMARTLQCAKCRSTRFDLLVVGTNNYPGQDGSDMSGKGRSHSRALHYYLGGAKWQGNAVARPSCRLRPKEFSKAGLSVVPIPQASGTPSTITWFPPSMLD